MGRRRKIVENPFNIKTEEAKYHTWAAAFAALNRDENPYSDQTDPELNAVWMQGWTANKNRKAPKRNKPIITDVEEFNDDLEVMTQTDDHEVAIKRTNAVLQKISDDSLLTELKKRKAKELEFYKAELKKIDELAAPIKVQIERLEKLMEL